ncbi:hypothetical protein [Xenorhabdus bovienii]|nr:hypothetical protein [Xenorhabdus bovienii]
MKRKRDMAQTCTMQEIKDIKVLKVVLREKGHAIRSLEFEM